MESAAETVVGLDFDAAGGTRRALTQCGFPAGAEIGQAFGRDALGADVELGPFARLLWMRPDLTDRMRLVVQQILVDAVDLNDWMAEFEVDVEASRARQQPVLWLRRFGPVA